MGSWKKFCSCCCFLCVNYLFNCFNSGAYTIIHLAGDSYCTSAWEAISLKIKEPASSAIVAFMGVVMLGVIFSCFRFWLESALRLLLVRFAI